MSQQRGIALLQVLLMSTIITLLAMQIARMAHIQVEIAQAIQDKALAEKGLRSMEAELLFALNTQPWTKAAAFKENDDTPSVVHLWNFYGKPFSIGEGETVTIQDDAGLISLFGGGSKGMVIAVLENILGSTKQAIGLRKALIDAQGYKHSEFDSGLQGQFFQTPEAMIQLSRPYGHEDEIDAVFTRMPHSEFHPLQAPDELLRLWLPKLQADAVIDARELGRLNSRSFSNLTGITSDNGVSFWPSGQFRIKLIFEKGKARAVRNLFLRISPRDIRPMWHLGVSG